MKPVKKIIVVAIGVLGIVFLVGILISKPLVTALLKQQLAVTFPRAEVEIGGVVVKPPALFSVQGLRVAREGAYVCSVQEAGIEISWRALIKRLVPRVFLRGVTITVETAKSLSECFSDVRIASGGKSFFVFQELALSEVQARVTSKDIQARLSLSITAHLPSQRITSILLDAPFLEINGCAFKDMHASLRSSDADGDLQIGQISYNKAKIKELKAKFRSTGKDFFFEPWSARFLNGEIQGALKVSLSAPVGYAATVNALNLDIAAFVKEFELAEKFQMDGKLSGELAFQGKGLSFTLIKGELLTAKPGGTLTIKDTRFLESMAKNAKQPLDILIDGFKNYPYTDGAVNLSLDNGNVVADVALAGGGGKRNFQVVLHDFDLEDVLQYQQYQ